MRVQRGLGVWAVIAALCASSACSSDGDPDGTGGTGGTGAVGQGGGGSGGLGAGNAGGSSPGGAGDAGAGGEVGCDVRDNRLRVSLEQYCHSKGCPANVDAARAEVQEVHCAFESDAEEWVGCGYRVISALIDNDPLGYVFDADDELIGAYRDGDNNIPCNAHGIAGGVDVPRCDEWEWCRHCDASAGASGAPDQSSFCPPGGPGAQGGSGGAG